MHINQKLATRIGKIVRKLSRLRGGSGSALPGLVIENLSPHYLEEALSELPQGIVIITGTNGKTTTTKMVVSLLRDQGLKVFTNKTGSNFTRGIVASALNEVNDAGIIEADIAVLELDEAYATHFVRKIPPSYCLLLNVMRDQLDRFGEIDHTAKLLKKVALATTEGIVLNRDDELVRAIANDIASDIHLRYFGLSPELKAQFPNDQELYGTHQESQSKLPQIRSTDVILQKIKDSTAYFSFGNSTVDPVELKIQGLYNMQNAAAALALVRMILGDDTKTQPLLHSLSEVKPAFGRGEAIDIDGYPLEIVLVKNPAGFRLALDSYKDKPASTMIAINDNYADGRDMSWLWDIDFTSLSKVAVVSGIRAYDMALRLQYEEVEIGQIETSIARAFEAFVKLPAGPKRIYCSYTAMMSLRSLIKDRFNLEAID